MALLKSMKTQIASGRRNSLRNNNLVVGHVLLGYKKRGGKERRHKSELIIDEETAPIVKDIYRMYLEEGAKAKLEIEYNSDGVWTDQGEIRGNRMRTIVLPVVPKRCDHLRFRIRGKGEIRVYSICRLMEVGADGGAY